MYELAKQNFYSTYENNEACQNTNSAIMEFMFTIHEKEMGCLIIYNDILLAQLVKGMWHWVLLAKLKNCQ